MISETVGRQLLFIRITVDDELNAYTVFETLNARGLELSATDLLKNYLFSRLKVEADLHALQRRWQALIATVQQERFPEFLRYHLLCEAPRIRSQRLFKLVRERVRDAAGAFALMEALERRAELFAALSDPNHAYWIERQACRPHVREFNIFRVRQMTPLLFAAWEKLEPDEFVRVLKLVSVVLFRYGVVSGLNANALEPIFHDAAKALLDGSARTPADLFVRLKPIYVGDAKFEQDFGRLAVDSKGLGRKLTRYLLAWLEADASARACDPDTDPGTVEHVLPENPIAAWEASFPPESWDDAIYRLGNMTWLEAPANRRVASTAKSWKPIVVAPTRRLEFWLNARRKNGRSRIWNSGRHTWRNGQSISGGRTLPELALPASATTWASPMRGCGRST